MSLSPVVIGPRCHYTNEFKELLTAEIILLGKEEEEANSLSNPFNKRVALENHRNALYQKFINIGGFFRFQSGPAAPREIVLENIKNYWSNYKVQVRKEVPKYDGISFPDFERKDLENKSERKAIISSMPLLIPDVRCYQNEFQKIEAPAIKFIHKSMTTVDVFKHRHGGTSYVNGAIFSNAHPKTDARIFKAEDYPLDLNLKLLDGSRTFTQVKVRNADKRKQSSFNTMKAAAPILKKTKPNCRTSHYSSTKTNYMIAFGRKKQQIMNSNRDFRFQLGKEEHNITKLASEMEVLMEKDFKLTLEHMKEMESVSTDNPTCVGKYAKSMDISKDLGNGVSASCVNDAHKKKITDHDYSFDNFEALADVVLKMKLEIYSSSRNNRIGWTLLTYVLSAALFSCTYKNGKKDWENVNQIGRMRNEIAKHNSPEYQDMVTATNTLFEGLPDHIRFVSNNRHLGRELLKNDFYSQWSVFNTKIKKSGNAYYKDHEQFMTLFEELNIAPKTV